jgi:transcriptional regulator with XRE-family HTH domain
MGRSSVVAKRIRQARELAGLSQQELGIRAGIDELSASSRISQYERGVHAPDFPTAERLAKVLRVPAPFFYATDDTLATWILAFGKISPAVRKEVLRKAGLTEDI